jgi:PAS domain S-box-containing protein
VTQIAELEEKIKTLELKLFKSEKIRSVLMERVEKNTEITGGAFTLFENNILLNGNVRQRTAELEQANKALHEEIARRKDIERALRINELRMAEVMDLSLIVHWDFDPSTRMLEANDAFYKFNGTTAEIEGGYRIPIEEYARRFIHPDDLHIFYQHKERMDSNPDMDIPPDLEHRIIRSDGKVRYIINRTRLVRNAEGHVSHVYGANQDITERKRMEDELLRSKESLEIKSLELSEAMELARIVNWEMDYKKDLFIFNDAFYAFLGTSAKKEGGYFMSPEEFAERFIYPEDLPLFFQFNKKVDENSEQEFVADLEHRIVRADGEVRDVLARTRVIKDTEGNILRIYGAIQDITERRQIEEDFKIKSRQLSEAMDIARIVYWDKDIEKGLFIFNEAFYELYGTTAEQEGGYLMPMDEYAKRFVYPDDLPVYLQHVEKNKTIQEGEFFLSSEHRIIRRDGEVRYIVARTRVFKDAEGNVIRLYGANQDITERKKMEEAISRSVSLLNATLESTTDGILVVDLAGKIVNFNNRFCEMWHIPDGVMKTKDDEQALAFVLNQFNRPEEFLAKVKEPYAQPEAESFDELHFKDGRVFERYSRPQYLDKEVVGRVWSFRDITEKNRTETALRMSEEKFRAMLETTSDFIWEADLNGIYTYASPRIKNILGYEPEEIVGERVVDFKSPEDAERVAGIIMEHSKSALPILEVEAIHLHKDGRPILFETNAVPIFDAKGQLSGYRGIDRDITRRKKAENALKETAHFLQTLMDAIPNPIFFKDTNFIYQGCNKAFVDYMGMSRDKIIGKSAYDVAPRELADRYQKMDEELFQQGGVQTYEGLVRYADGTHHNVIFSKAIYADASGSLRGLVGVINDITRRKQIEEILAKSLAVQKSVIESPKDVVIFALDREYRYIAFNKNHRRTMEQIWGADIAIGVSMLEYIKDPEDREKAKINFDRALSGESFTIVEEYGDIQMERRYYENTYNPIIDKNGDVIGLTLFLSDVTERRQAEEKLQISESYYKSLIENISDIISIIDPDGTIRYESPSVEHVMGYKPSELVGQSVFNTIHPDDLKYMKEDFYTDLTKHGPKIPDVVRRMHKDGSWRFVEVNGQNMLDDEIINGMLIISRDITERRKTEELLKQSEERYRMIAESAHDTIWTVDLNGRMTYISPSVKRLTGYTPEEVMQSGLNLMTPASIAIAKEDMQRIIFQCMAGAIPEPKHLELEFIRKDGSMVWAEMTSNPLFDASGQFVGVQGVSRDVTDRKRAREELQKLNDELEQKVEERTNQLIETQEELVRKGKLAVLGQLAGIVGHEIRNPLAVINNAAYFLKTVLENADETVKEYLDMIKDEIANSQRIITDLLDFARTKSPQPQLFETKALLKQSLAKIPIPQNIAFDMDIPEGLQPLWVDPNQMEQVLRNLIINAIDAMHDGGAMHISACEAQGGGARAQGAGIRDQRSDKTEPRPLIPDPGFVKISISDTGTGISPENMKKLFQPLFTTKTKGIGLGLVVCKNLVEANGGRIEVMSKQGEGTNFLVSLPIEQNIDD